MAQNVHADPGEGRAGVDEKNGGFTLTDNMEEIVKFAASCGRTTFCWFYFTQKAHLEERMKNLIEAAER